MTYNLLMHLGKLLKTMSILLRNGKMQLIFGQNWARNAIRGVCSRSFGFYNILFGMMFLITCGIGYLLTLSKQLMHITYIFISLVSN